MAGKAKVNSLDSYRCRASFNVPALRNYLYGEEVVEYTQQVLLESIAFNDKLTFFLPLPTVYT